MDESSSGVVTILPTLSSGGRLASPEPPTFRRTLSFASDLDSNRSDDWDPASWTAATLSSLEGMQDQTLSTALRVTRLPGRVGALFASVIVQFMEDVCEGNLPSLPVLLAARQLGRCCSQTVPAIVSIVYTGF